MAWSALQLQPDEAEASGGGIVDFSALSSYVKFETLETTDFLEPLVSSSLGTGSVDREQSEHKPTSVRCFTRRQILFSFHVDTRPYRSIGRRMYHAILESEVDAR